MGRVVLQVTLARGLRESRAVRAFVELADPEHANTLQHVLAASPLSLSVIGSRLIVLPEDADLKAEHLLD
jgi:hypothetical protein